MANDWWAIANRREDLLDECAKLPPHDEKLFENFKNIITPMSWDEMEMGNLDFAVKHLYLMVQRFVVAGYNLPSKSSGKWERFIKDLDSKAEIFECITDVLNEDFQTVIERFDSPRTLFYVDPPYYSTENYYHHEFPREDHLRLAECLKKIEGKFALSYYEFPELSEWFPEDEYPWYRHAARNMMGAKKGKKIDSVKQKGGGRDVEVLVKNYSANDALSEAKRKLIEF